MINATQLNHLKAADIKHCDIAQLSDLTAVRLDRSGTLEQRLDAFLHQIQNPYLFRVGEIAVKLEFGSHKRFADALADLLCAQ